MERTKQRTKIKESTGERIFTGVIYAILILFCAIIVFPLLHIVSGSFSDPMALLRGEVSFWPKGFTFSMYEKVFKDASIWQGYGNTIVYTVLGTCISVVLTAFAAYPLSRKDFYGRNLFMGVFVFTMFFTGGMIPKTDCCAEAVAGGVKRTHIIDGRIPHSILIEMLTDEGIGTMILNEEEHV